MLGVQNNPFHKANPFRIVQYEKFEHPHLATQKQQDHHTHPHLYKDYLRPAPARPLENNWTFNQNNLDRRVDFTRKPELTNSRVSDFEMKMKMSGMGVGVGKQAQKVAYVQEGRLENPFFRKNLLLNKEEVMNQVQLDVSLYRNKARSSYDSRPITVTNIPQSTYTDSPIVSRPRPSISDYPSNNQPATEEMSVPYEDNSPSPTLGYSPTLEPTQRVSSRHSRQEQAEKEQPACITFKGKKFFLNN